MVPVLLLLKILIGKIKQNNEEYYLMHCEPDTLIKLNDNSLKIINHFEKKFNNDCKLTFFKINNYEIRTKLYNGSLININIFLNCNDKVNFDYTSTFYTFNNFLKFKDNFIKHKKCLNNDTENYHPYHKNIIEKIPKCYLLSRTF